MNRTKQIEYLLRGCELITIRSEADEGILANIAQEINDKIVNMSAVDFNKKFLYNMES